ncbi:RES family NAD+ phosphorylase [Salinibacter ruber]|uniref:RES family NAD+ phosphorylase n=1 Tax=Salinibacter ruber TaxID=146919 RepID=UPI001C66AAC4|nr:RES family NAD+ phosphorylase [Salinibacter ruber]MCS3610073.1 RES domain-containing protein [Salinibacter ruber]MCS3648110.1 RES domain-containing protein [Salinibacter ruber]
MSNSIAWRIPSEKYGDTAFSGKGAKEYGGRFNSVGTPVVYTSESISLATPERLAKAGACRRLSGRVVLPAAFDEKRVTVYEKEDLPEGLGARPYGPAGQQVGDQWGESEASAVFRVPSVVVPAEHNYLINPRHPEFEELEIGAPRPLALDPRLPAE